MRKLDSGVWIVVFSFILVGLIYSFVIATTPTQTAQIIKLTQFYALAAVIYLYLALLARPFIEFFPNFSFKKQYLESRSALVVGALVVAAFHSLIAFFGELGGFEGLGFLGWNYLFPITLSLTVLFILALFSLSLIKRFEKLLQKLYLDKLLYAAGILILIHALILGSHFTNVSSVIMQISLVALIFYFLLEAISLDKYLQKRFKKKPQFGIVLPLTLMIVSGGLVFLYGGSVNTADSPFNLHAAHIEIAKQAQSGNIGSAGFDIKKIPGFSGDPTKRFTVSFLHPDNILPNTEVPLTFQVFDANSGSQIQIFQKNYEKIVHLVIVDSELKYFAHIHPEQTEKGFEIKTTFPHPGQYRLYTNFLPLGAIEQQFGFPLNVGNFEKPVFSNAQPDQSLTKTFDNYEVTLDYPKPLRAKDLSVGLQTLSFTLRDAKTKEPVTNLKPYLSAFGHLVMINTQTLEYLHVHPSNLVAPPPDASSGPTVDFLPLGLYGPVKPGIYRLFAQFNPDNKLFTADFTVKIE